MESAPPTALDGPPRALSFCESSVLCCYDIQASQDSCKLQVTVHGEPGLGCIYEAALEFYGILRSVTVIGVQGAGSTDGGG